MREAEGVRGEGEDEIKSARSVSIVALSGRQAWW